jgi:hypothetical protein
MMVHLFRYLMAAPSQYLYPSTMARNQYAPRIAASRGPLTVAKHSNTSCLGIGNMKVGASPEQKDSLTPGRAMLVISTIVVPLVTTVT